MNLNPVKFGTVLGLLSKGKVVDTDHHWFDRSVGNFEKRATAAGVPCIVLPHLSGGEERDGDGYRATCALVITGEDAAKLKPQETALKMVTKEILDLWRRNQFMADMIEENNRMLSKYSRLRGALTWIFTPQEYPAFVAEKARLKKQIAEDETTLTDTATIGLSRLKEFHGRFGSAVEALRAAYIGSYNIYHAPSGDAMDMWEGDMNFPQQAEKLALTGKMEGWPDSQHWPFDCNEMTFRLPVRIK